MSLWPEYESSKLLESNFSDKKEYNYWKSFFNKFYNDGCSNTWDYQWFFCSLINQGLTAIPNQNLIDNIGFGADATHTKKGKSPIKVLNQIRNKRDTTNSSSKIYCKVSISRQVS